jgi:hypothetical protein
MNPNSRVETEILFIGGAYRNKNSNKIFPVLQNDKYNEVDVTSSDTLYECQTSAKRPPLRDHGTRNGPSYSPLLSRTRTVDEDHSA